MYSVMLGYENEDVCSWMNHSCFDDINEAYEHCWDLRFSGFTAVVIES